MPLDPASQLLIDTLHGLQELDGRYEQLQIANRGATHQGVFSLVFSAHDKIDNCRVAIKFFDPAHMGIELYRQEAFRREHSLLQTLVGKGRCLQLVSPLNTYRLSIPGGPAGLTLPCEYFVTEWLDLPVDEFFARPETFDPIEKLKLFNDAVLGVEALQRHDIFHRDLKADNLRAIEVARKRIVKAIDLGTAARATSPRNAGTYPPESVGAKGYAPPEARAGLAGHRGLAHYSDRYALGCLLWELFNPGYFFRIYFLRNPNYGVVVPAMATFGWHVATGPGRGVAPCTRGTRQDFSSGSS